MTEQSDAGADYGTAAVEPPGRLGVVVVTQKSAKGALVVQALAHQRVPIEAIVLDRGSVGSRTHVRRLRAHTRRVGPMDVVRLARKQVVRRFRRFTSEAEWKHDDFYRPFASSVRKVLDLNGPESVKMLTDMAPDVIVIGSSRILRSNVISIPRIGALNAHPGLLPAYRGVDVIPWAILNGDPVGVTVHFVDPGVDTGDIVTQRPIDVYPTDSLPRIMKRANQVGAEDMASAVAKLMTGRDLDRSPQSAQEGQQYWRMPLPLRKEVEAIIKTLPRPE